MKPYYQDNQLTIYQGDALETLKKFPEESIDCVVTSPPYFSIRDYGTGKWEGGSPDCDHLPSNNVTSAQVGNTKAGLGRQPYRDICGKCGAKRIDLQLGLEPTRDHYIKKLCDVFDEIQRVLKKEGTCWVNLGDTYGGSWQNYGAREGHQRRKNTHSFNRAGNPKEKIPPSAHMTQKCLMQMPSRIAIEMTDRGWILRNTIIWQKPNAMPESAKDRFTVDHEYVFFFVKSKKYYFEQQLIDVSGDAHARGNGANPKSRKWKTPDGWDTSIGKGGHGSIHKEGREKGYPGYQHKTRPKQNESFSSALAGLVEKRNKRTVWTIPTQPYPEVHFATFPEKLVAPMIKAGCLEGGTVLDPFCGSGTTLLVAEKLGRKAIGIDLKEEYCEMSLKRCNQRTFESAGKS